MPKPDLVPDDPLISPPTTRSPPTLASLRSHATHLPSKASCLCLRCSSPDNSHSSLSHFLRISDQRAPPQRPPLKLPCPKQPPCNSPTSPMAALFFLLHLCYRISILMTVPAMFQAFSKEVMDMNQLVNFLIILYSLWFTCLSVPFTRN